MSEREQLEWAILHLEGQRTALGDAAVDAALAGLRQKLDELENAEGQEPVDPVAPELVGERKWVTIMFVDISGFTSLAETMDPEAVRNLVNACFDHLVPVIERYGGMVTKFIGDCIESVFGAPVAHENDPERALRCALEILDTMAEFNAERGTDLGLHLGINTGLVVAGNIGSRERHDYAVTGDAINLAARLEDASERGEILVGPDTYRLTAPRFTFETLEPIEVQGKRDPVQVYRLVGTGTTQETARGIEGLRSVVVGRDSELHHLQEIIAGLGQGRGMALALVAEAGLGKSRLVAELKQIAPPTVSWVEGRALSYTQGMAYWIVRDLLRELLGYEANAALTEISSVLQDSIHEELPEGAYQQVWPYLGHLLDLPLDELTAGYIASFSPHVLQQRITEALSSLVRARAQQPLALVWEDLHWADSSSLTLLGALLPLTQALPLLLVFVFRPEQGLCWRFHQRLLETKAKTYQVIELSPLGHAHSTQLMQNLLRIANLPVGTRDLILGKAEGNPLFLEELLRSLLEAGLIFLKDGRAVASADLFELREVDVPDTLQGVISARVDRLPAHAKGTLQTAAVVGRVFQRQVLEYVREQEHNGHELDGALEELQERQLIRLREALARDLEYIFKHVLTQETAYGSLLLAQRKVLHKAVGEAIEALFPDRLDELAATLAYHFERANLTDRAIDYLLQAGTRAARLSAGEEAVAHFATGLDLLEDLPDTPERTAKELALQTASTVVLMHIRGYSNSEVGRAVERAQALCKQIGENPEVLPVVHGLWAFYFARGDYQQALSLGEQILRMALGAEDSAIPLLLGHNAQAANFFMLGEMRRSLEHAEHAIALEAPSTITLTGQEIKGCTLSWTAIAQCMLGYYDQGQETVRQNLSYIREIGHPATSGFSLTYITLFHQLSRELQATKNSLSELLTLSREYGLMLWEAWGTIWQGWTMAMENRALEGIEKIQQGRAMFDVAGAGAFLPYNLAMLAEAHEKAGQLEEGLAALDEALRLVEVSGERFYEAEIHRLKGDLLLKSRGEREDVRRHYDTAIAVASRLHAKSLELKATVGLSLLLREQGEREEARRRLADAYGCFTEGLDSVDLREAKALLDELS